MCQAACWPDEEGPLSPSRPEYLPLESVQVGNWIFSFGAGPTEHPAGWGSYQVCSQTLARWKEVASNLDTQWAQDGPTATEHLLWKVACFFIIGTVPAIASTAAMIAPCFQKVIRLAERKGSVGLYKAFCMLVLVVYTYR